jgi:hypothetical protein
VEAPKDVNELLRHLHTVHEDASSSALADEDEAYLKKLLSAIRSGKPAIIIVEDSGTKLKYMFSNRTRAEAIVMLGKVVEATGTRLVEDD